jgi:hypothetical protein
MMFHFAGPLKQDKQDKKVDKDYGCIIKIVGFYELL